MSLVKLENIPMDAKRKRKYVKKAMTGLPEALKLKKSVLSSPKQKRKPSTYNLFVQKHLKSPTLSGVSQKEKMKKVAELWRASKKV